MGKSQMAVTRQSVRVVKLKVDCGVQQDTNSKQKQFLFWPIGAESSLTIDSIFKKRAADRADN
jgi:hypothetical protein